MGKISKKRKIIITVATILILIILAIIICKKLIINNKQIINKGFLSTVASEDSNVIASYIKEGITIGGVTGTFQVLDTSDANVKPEDIAKGKTIYADGVKITGTREPEFQYFTDSLGNLVKVPLGFEVVNPEDNVTDGIIIEDVNAGNEYTKGSQFVWIPVGYVITDENKNTEKIELGRYTFSTTGEKNLEQIAYEWSKKVYIDFDCRELETSSYGNATAKSLKDFAEKTLENGGYYIGRYEAGDANATSSRHPNIDTTNPITCKSGVYPYTYIEEPKASLLCQEMYNDGIFESDLINSYAWDTAIVFIQTFSGDIDYSRQEGDVDIYVEKCGERMIENNESGDKELDVRCNIYDMAGNTYEYTTETLPYTKLYSVTRGGDYAGYRYTGPSIYTYGCTSFRPILY